MKAILAATIEIRVSEGRENMFLGHVKFSTPWIHVVRDISISQWHPSLETQQRDLIIVPLSEKTQAPVVCEYTTRSFIHQITVHEVNAVSVLCVSSSGNKTYYRQITTLFIYSRANG
jgi:hypothetical protein